jgi:hypothetical protein
MKRLLLILIVLTGLSKAQSSSNIDFEAGNLSGWTVTSGTVNGIGTASVMTGCCSTAGSPEAIIINTPIYTGYINYLPNSPLGGSKVLKLNDSIGGNGLASRISFPIVVSATNFNFQYAISVIVGGLLHTCGDFGYANVRILDASSSVIYNNHFEPAQNSTTVNCGNSTAFTSYTAANTAAFCWKTYAVNLAPYIGTSVTIEVTAGDCTGWAHVGYCYFDATTNGTPPLPVSCSAPSLVNESIVNSADVSVFPNPVKDILNVYLNVNNAELFIYDVLGKVVAHKSDLQNENRISIKNLDQGLYFYNIVQNNRSVKTGKIIKE